MMGRLATCLLAVLLSCGLICLYPTTASTFRAKCGADPGGQALLGSVLAVSTGRSRIECAGRCARESSCKSINYEAKTRTCQLNSAVAPSCGALATLPGHKYLEKINYEEDACQNNGVWISEGCGCRCPVSFKGFRCEDQYPVAPSVDYVGNPVLSYPRALLSQLNIMLDVAIPVDTNIVSVSYSLTTSGGVSYLSVWRSLGGGSYMYVSGSQLLENGAGYHKHHLACPLPVKQGDLLGIHSNGTNPMSMAICSDYAEGSTPPCDQGTYGTLIAKPGLYDYNLVKGAVHSLATSSFKRIYALRAHFS